VQASPNDVDAIRRQMSRIRRKQRAAVREVLADARRVAGWASYLRPVAWAGLGAAAATAICTINKRAAKARGISFAPIGVAEEPRHLANGRTGNSESPKIQQGLFDSVWKCVAPIVVRAAQDYALRQLEQWIAQEQTAATIHGSPRSDGNAEGPNLCISPPDSEGGDCQCQERA
jgi:hypothetical protein